MTGLLGSDPMITIVSAIGSFIAVAGIAILVLFWNKLITPNEPTGDFNGNSLEIGDANSTDLNLSDIYDNVPPPTIMEHSPMGRGEAHYL